MDRRHPTPEIDFQSANGYLGLAVGLALLGAAVLAGTRGSALVLVPAALLGLLALRGLYMLEPGRAALLLLFGEYRGTDRSTGLRWANPFYARRTISLRVHNLTSEHLKVNDRRGNPIEIAAAVVWRVQNTARAAFDVESFESFVHVQAEAAIRHLASRFAYDSDEETGHDLTLRGGSDAILAELKTELGQRLEQAGLEVIEARLTHLAYAPEIAGAMLRRQQAEAVIAARKQIVTGAVSMVEMALAALEERGVLRLDPDRRAAMVSNLLVVLCGDSEAQPVINTGAHG